MTAKNVLFQSTPKQMSDSWIVIDEHDESDYVLIDNENDKQQAGPNAPNAPKTNSTQAAGTTQNKQNKKRKWKVLYSLPATGTQGNVNAANLDSYVMDQHAQLVDKRDLFSAQQRIVKVK